MRLRTSCFSSRTIATIIVSSSVMTLMVKLVMEKLMRVLLDDDGYRYRNFFRHALMHVPFRFNSWRSLVPYDSGALRIPQSWAPGCLLPILCKCMPARLLICLYSSRLRGEALKQWLRSYASLNPSRSSTSMVTFSVILLHRRGARQREGHDSIQGLPKQFCIDPSYLLRPSTRD